MKKQYERLSLNRSPCGPLTLVLLVSFSTASVADGPHQYFELGDFALECGTTLPDARLCYVTHGELNSDKSNAVLTPSWYSGDHHGYEYLIGTGKALDPKKYFIISTDMFADGFSSSPSNTPAPFSGPDFPPITIRDNVKATHRLVTEKFGIERLHAVIGFSMGAQQAFQWSVSYPDMMGKVVGYCGNAREYPFGYVRLEGAKSALTADAAWNEGRYESPPVVGLKALARHWATWGSSQQLWRDLFLDKSFSDIEARIREDEAYWLSKDANNLLSQAVTWQSHNVGDTPGFDGDLKAALHSIKADVLIMPSETDLYFPPEDSEYESQFILNVKLVRIPSLWGHNAGGGNNPEDVKFLNEQIENFLSLAITGS